MKTEPASPQHDPDIQEAERLIMEAFGWDEEQAAAHYAVHRRCCEAVAKGIRGERKKHQRRTP